MAHIVQVGAGSGGMPVLDLLCQDPSVTRITLIEPDLYKPHNVVRHVFPNSWIGQPKATLADRWLRERRPELEIHLLQRDLLDPSVQGEIEAAVAMADVGVCAADNEPAKYHWDALMRRYARPWTLGEVLSGGIGGFVHRFVPGGPCYGCVASYFQRSGFVEKEKAPDYSQPGGAVAEVTVPAGKASIHAIASIHALVTFGVLHERADYDPGFTSLLWTLKQVPEVFQTPFRAFPFQVAKAADCLICGVAGGPRGGAATSAEDLDGALDQALARLGHA